MIVQSIFKIWNPESAVVVNVLTSYFQEKKSIIQTSTQLSWEFLKLNHYFSELLSIFRMPSNIEFLN